MDDVIVDDDLIKLMRVRQLLMRTKKTFSMCYTWSFGTEAHGTGMSPKIKRALLAAIPTEVAIRYRVHHGKPPPTFYVIDGNKYSTHALRLELIDNAVKYYITEKEHVNA